MIKLFCWIGACAGGWIGWWLGARLGFGWAFTVSSLGSIAGVFIGWKIAADCF